MKKNILFASILSVLTLSSVGQQLPISSLYQQNRVLFNPANSGDQDGPVLQLNHKQLLMGIKGAPNNQFLTLQTALNDYMGISGVIKNTNSEIIQQTSASLNYSYAVDVALDHRLSFGLGATYYQNSLDLSNVVVQDPTELNLFNANLNGSSANFDFGIRYNWDALEIGISANQLLANRLNGFSPSDNRFNQFRTHYNFLGSYDYEVNSDFTLTPIVLVRYIDQVGMLNDYMIGLNYRDLVWGNLGYRDESNFIVTVGTWITNQLALNYAYNYSTTMIALESFGTHEVSLNFKLKKSEGGGPYKGKVEEGNLTEKEKAIIDEADKRREERESLRQQKEEERIAKEAEKAKGSKTIKIKTDGFESDEEIVIKPGSGGGTNTEDLQNLKEDMDAINSKLDKLLKADFNDIESRDSIEEQILELRKKLVELLDKNDPENVHEVSGQIEGIQKKIEELRKKLEE